MDKSLTSIIRNIGPADREYLVKAREHTAQLLMPARAMGRLHEISEQICSIQQTLSPCTDTKEIIVMAGDHGITEEGVSAYPAEITGMMVQAFISGNATVNVIAQQLGAAITVADMGIRADIPPSSGFIVKKIAHGTNNFTQGPAMSRNQAEESILAGIETAEKSISGGTDILATGDMGIGNTTPSTAIGTVITGKKVEEMTGRGTGVDDKGLQKKIDTVKRGIEINRPDPSDGLDVLSKVGGFEIGGIAGICLAAACHRIPVVIDGLISTAGALISHAVAPLSAEYMLAGHCSFEKGHCPMLSHIGLEPLLDLGMRLGEGTGGALAMHIIQSAVNIFSRVSTFKDAGIETE